MSDKTGIEWTDATWNPLAGCSIVSPGCTNCYAMKMADRLSAMADKPDGTGNPHLLHYVGATTRDPTSRGYEWSSPVWTGKVVQAPGHILTQPLRWKRPRRIFVNSMSDLFHEAVPDAWIDQVFAVMALCPQHVFQVLTKRPERMRRYLSAPDVLDRVEGIIIANGLGDMMRSRLLPGIDEKLAPPGQRVFLGLWPLPNVWLGTSVEDQRRADERIPHLLATPAAIRFISAEPLLGPVDLKKSWQFIEGVIRPSMPALDWVIVGGESGPGARPMHPDWARALRDQCTAAGVAFFFKQWGEWVEWPEAAFSSEEAESLDAQGRYAYFQRDSAAPHVHLRRVGKSAAGRLLDGVEHNGMPVAR